MPQSLAAIYVHLVFSTKHRARVLDEMVRPDLHGYIAGILAGQGCPPIEINSVLDHVHCLFCLGRTVPLSDVVAGVKRSSNDWLRRRDWRFRDFHWQSGFGAFSVSQSNLGRVTQYIRNQQEHHRTVSFQDELRQFLRRYGIDFDERYLWD